MYQGRHTDFGVFWGEDDALHKSRILRLYEST